METPFQVGDLVRFKQVAYSTYMDGSHMLPGLTTESVGIVYSIHTSFLGPQGCIWVLFPHPLAPNRRFATWPNVLELVGRGVLDFVPVHEEPQKEIPFFGKRQIRV